MIGNTSQRVYAGPPFSRPVIVAALAIACGTVLGVAVVVARNPLYIVGALLGLAVGLAMVASTRLSLLVFVGVSTLLPFAVIPIPLGTFKLTALDITLSLLLLTWLARLLVKRDERYQTSGLEAPLAVFIALAVFSYLGGTNTTSETARLFLKMINSILFFFSVVNCVRTWRQISEAILALIVGAAASGALGLLLYFIPTATSSRLLAALGAFGYPNTGQILRYLPSTTTLRAISTSIDPNIFGAMLMLALVLAFGQAIAAKPIADRRLIVVAGGLIFAALLLSYSRGSLFGALAGVALIAIYRYRRGWLLVFPVVALVALLVPNLGGVPVIGVFLSHLQSGVNAQDQAAAMRLGEYKDAYKLIQQYPWFGVGFGVAPDVDLYVGVSSIYLLLAEQMGLVGLASYLVTVGVLLWRAGRTLLTVRLSPERESLLLGTTAALVSALVAGLADHHFVNLRFPHVVALFWLLAALMVVAGRLARAPQEA